MTIVFIILGVAIVLFLSDRVRPDLVALLVVLGLGLTGILTAQEAFSGFSGSAVITILSVFILATGLERTGMPDQVGKLLLRIAGAHEKWLSILVMASGAFLSLFMNNIAAASILLPAVSGAARRTNISLSRLLMPLAFGTILGGMATLFTTVNIVVSALLRDQGIRGYGIFDFLPLGIPLVLVGVAYMALWGRRLLPAKSTTERYFDIHQAETDLVGIYRLGERLIRGAIQPGSDLIGVPLGESHMRETYNLNVIAIIRDSRVIHSPSPGDTFQEGDIVLFEGRQEDLSNETLKSSLEILSSSEIQREDLESRNMALVEAILPPRSSIIGQTLRSVHFREKYQMSVLAIWRSDRPIRTRISDLPLQFGDALLLQGPRENLAILQSESDLVLLTSDEVGVPLSKRKALLTLAIMVTTLVLAATGQFSVPEVMLGGALTMILLGILTMDQAYQAIEWKTVFLVAGMLPMGIAMTKTGAAAFLGNGLMTILGPSGALALLGGMAALTVLLTQAINGAAVATLIAPIAIITALRLGLNPRSMAMGIALAASMAFITPLGHPVNMLVMGLGGYRFRDYIKVGLPLTLLLFAVMMILLPIFWPLQ